MIERRDASDNEFHSGAIAEVVGDSLSNEPFPHNALEPTVDKAVAEALGVELRRAREKIGWSRVGMVKFLPSGIGDRTLLAYEHGKRQLTVNRLLEITRELGVGAPHVLTRALQRAQIDLDNLSLQVDLRMLLKDNNTTYLPMRQWAKNRLKDATDGVVDVHPAAVRDLAAFIGKPIREMQAYLAQFLPEDPDTTDDEPLDAN